MEVVDISDLNDVPQEVAANELAIGAMVEAGIDPDYEGYQAARESCEVSTPTNEMIFKLVSGSIDNTVLSVCDFGWTVSPIVLPSRLTAALKLSDEELADAIDGFNDGDTFNQFYIDQRGPWLTMEYAGSAYSPSMAE